MLAVLAEADHEQSRYTWFDDAVKNKTQVYARPLMLLLLLLPPSAQQKTPLLPTCIHDFYGFIRFHRTNAVQHYKQKTYHTLIPDPPLTLSYLRDAEISQHHPAAAEDEDVLRFDVAVEHAARVHVVQPERCLHEPGHHLAFRQQCPLALRMIDGARSERSFSIEHSLGLHL